MVSTAGDATLSVADPSTTATGQAGQRRVLAATSRCRRRPPRRPRRGGRVRRGRRLGRADVAGELDDPVSNDPVTIGFQQTILANEPLRTGTYAKTLTFTLSTTTP